MFTGGPRYSRGLSSQKYSTNTKTAIYKRSLFQHHFCPLKRAKSADNQWKYPRITYFVHKPRINKTENNKPADNDGRLDLTCDVISVKKHRVLLGTLPFFFFPLLLSSSPTPIRPPRWSLCRWRAGFGRRLGESRRAGPVPVLRFRNFAQTKRPIFFARIRISDELTNNQKSYSRLHTLS